MRSKNQARLLISVSVLALSLLTAYAAWGFIFGPPSSIEQPSPTPDTVLQTPAPLAPGRVNENSLAWSADDAWLAFTTQEGQAWLLPAGQQQTAIPVPGIQAWPYANLNTAWSPEGTSLLVYGAWGDETPQWTALWLVSVDSQGPKEALAVVEPVRPELKVHQNSGEIYSVSWAADGRRLAYSFQADAWIYDLTTQTAVQVTHIPENPLSAPEQYEPFDGLRRVSLSPAGQWLAFDLSCNCPGPFSGTGLLDLESGAVRLLQKNSYLLGWSPDGHWVTIRNATGDYGRDYTYDVYGVEPASGQVTNLTRSNPLFDPLLQNWDGNFKPSEYQVTSLKWGPRGEFLYTLEDFFIEGAADPDLTGSGFIAKRSLLTLLVKYLPTAQASYLFPSWLPDSSLAYIRVVPAEENNWGLYPDWQPYILERQVETQKLKGMLVSAAWSPQGSYLAVLLSDLPSEPERRLEIIPIHP
jgi:WD40 repeat protein